MIKSWTPSRAAASSRGHLKSLRKELEKRLRVIACLWGDEDGFLERLADEKLRLILSELDELDQHIAEALAAKPTDEHGFET
jgi:hypothetical protein